MKMNFLNCFNLIAILAVAGFLAVDQVAGQNPPTDADCTGPDPFPDPVICSSYYQCFLTDTGYVLMHLDCPSGGVWKDNACVEGTCDEATTTAEPTTEAPSTSTTEAITSEASSDATTGVDASTTEAEVTSDAPIITTEVTTLSTEPESTTTSPVTSDPPTFQCPSQGLFPHPTDPRQYYQCILIGSQFYYYVYSCPTNSCFQMGEGRCVVNSCPGSVTTTSSTPASTSPSTTTKTTTTIAKPTTTTTRPTTTTTTTTARTTTSATTPPSNPCPTEGLFPSPNDCQSYIQCIRVNGRMYIYNYRCQPGTYFSTVYNRCVVGTCPA